MREYGTDLQECGLMQGYQGHWCGIKHRKQTGRQGQTEGEDESIRGDDEPEVEEVEEGDQDGGGHRGEARLPAKKLQTVFE